MRSTAPWFYWVVAVSLMLWGLIGCVEWVMQFMYGPAAMGRTSEYDLQLHAGMPGWYDYSHAASVSAMLAGGIGLLLRARWAQAAFLLSMIAAIAQFGYLFAATDIIAEKGAITVVPFPVLIILIAFAAMVFAGYALRRNWVI